MGNPKGESTVRTLAVLRERIGKRERGTMSRAEKALGLGSGYLSKWWSRGSLEYEKLMKVLEFLDIDPCEFFREVFGDEEDPAGSGASGARPGIGRKRPKLAPGGPDPQGVPGWIEELDELRYHDAEAAIRELWSRVDDVEGAAVAHYLGALGSAYRSIGNLPEARECLQRAEARAVDDLGFGDALQRLAYLSLYEGDAEGALGLSEQAAGVFARSGLWVRFGEAHVEQAQALFHLGDLQGQWRCLDIAERNLTGAPQTSRLTRYLFTIAQFRALNRQRYGDLEPALGYSGEARKFANSPGAVAFCFALEGAILRDAARPLDAAQAFRRQRDLLASDPCNALAATVEIVHCLALAGKNREAYAEAERFAPLLGSFGASSPVGAAAMELWVQARKRRLAIATLDSVRAALEAERATSQPSPSLGARVGRLRRLAGLSRVDLATQTGVPLATLRRLEAGSCPATKHEPALEHWSRGFRPEAKSF